MQPDWSGNNLTHSKIAHSRYRFWLKIMAHCFQHVDCRRLQFKRIPCLRTSKRVIMVGVGKNWKRAPEPLSPKAVPWKNIYSIIFLIFSSPFFHSSTLLTNLSHKQHQFPELFKLCAYVKMTGFIQPGHFIRDFTENQDAMSAKMRNIFTGLSQSNVILDFYQLIMSDNLFNTNFFFPPHLHAPHNKLNSHQQDQCNLWEQGIWLRHVLWITGAALSSELLWWDPLNCVQLPYEWTHLVSLSVIACRKTYS